MYKKYIYIYINFQKQKKIIQKYGDCAFCNLAFYNVAYNIFKIKSYIFKIFYIIINKYIDFKGRSHLLRADKLIQIGIFKLKLK